MRTSRTHILSGAWQLILIDHLFLSVYGALLMLLRKQGGDDDGDDHEHEDEHDLYTQWRLATYFDGSPLLVCIQRTADVTTKEAGIVSHDHTLQTYSNISCRVFRMDTSELAPTPSP